MLWDACDLVVETAGLHHLLTYYFYFFVWWWAFPVIEKSIWWWSFQIVYSLSCKMYFALSPEVVVVHDCRDENWPNGAVHNILNDFFHLYNMLRMHCVFYIPGIL